MLFILQLFLLCGLGMAVPIEEVIQAAPGPVAAPPVVVVKESPGVVAPPAATPQQVPSSEGNGFITEHKNPDGSTITITRFNGPLPASSFPQNPFGIKY
jgi:hypothetical protein